MNSLDYDCPYANYKRLIETRDFLMQCQTPHPNFYDTHINHIRQYVQVLKATSEVNQTAMPLLKKLIKEYKSDNTFNLLTYLEICNILLGNISEFQMQQSLEQMAL